MKKYLGVDLHKTSLTVVVLDEQGQPLELRTLPTKCRLQIQQFFSSHGPHAHVVVESVGFYLWFSELIKPLVERLVLADPAGVRAFVGRQAKTDRLDAHLLADLLRTDRLPTAYVPRPVVRPLRELVRHRHSVSRALALQRRHLRWQSLKLNLLGPAHLSSARPQKWLLAQDDKFNPVHRFAARHRLDQITSLERHLADADRLIADRVAADPGLARQVELLQSIPGVGPLVATTILAELGDPTRFDSPDQLSAYAGLAPRVHQSGHTLHHGHISKQSPPVLRWVLQQAAWVARRTSNRARRIWARIARRAGEKKAAVAFARKILIYAWSVCRRGQPFRWPELPAVTVAAR